MGEVIGQADNQMHEGNRELSGPCVYHERPVLAVPVRFRADLRFCSIEDGVAATREALFDEQPDLSPGGVIVSVPTKARDEVGDWGLKDIVTGPSSGCELSQEMLLTIQGVWGYQSQIMNWMPFEMRSAAYVTV